MLTEDAAAPPLVYDRFTAVALTDCTGTLMLDDGLLADRGNGDSADHHRTLPDPA